MKTEWKQYLLFMGIRNNLIDNSIEVTMVSIR